MSESPLHVIVLDDRSRFALHVWRYLSRSVGFGIGDVPPDGVIRSKPGEDAFPEMKRPWRLPSPARDAVIGGVYVRKVMEEPDLWVNELDEALEKTQGTHRVFLIDVRGEPAGPPQGFWRVALNALAARGALPEQKDVWLVSSYGMGICRFEESDIPFNISPKSSETLQKLAERVWLPRRERPAESAPKAYHFLVTGAGFELKRRGPLPISPLGIPSTHELLEEAYKAKIWEARDKVPRPKLDLEGSFPLPPFVGAAPRYRGLASSPAYERDLDLLWNALLDAVLKRAENANEEERPNFRKAVMLADEASARESFRNSFLGDDWGQLTQALDAAALPWDAWLTTNYTHFVDRAVALQKNIFEGALTPLPWQIISIATEAEHLLRRMFFDGKPKLSERFIFKLHGDLAHLSTMAVAGQDKELFSQMTQAVDGLVWLYQAAQKWIERLLSMEDEAHVHWHIVGHGLKDKALMDTINDVISSTRTVKLHHSVLFIQPGAENALKSVTLPKSNDAEWLPQDHGADAWLAMLRKFCHIKGRMWTLEDGDLHEAVCNSISSANELSYTPD